jgi:hypothetical protein
MLKLNLSKRNDMEPDSNQPSPNDPDATPAPPNQPTPSAPEPASTPATNPEPPTPETAPATSAEPAVPPPAETQSPAPAAALPSVPDSWPGAFGVYKYSKAAVKFNGNTYGLLILLYLVVGIVIDIIFRGSLGAVISNVVSAYITAGIYIALLLGVRRQKVSTKASLSRTWPLLGLKYLLLSLLVGLSLLVSFLLLIVPFFFVLPRLALANYYLIDKNMRIIEAYKTSWAATKGHAGKVWGVIGAVIVMALLMITIIGIPVAFYLLIMYSAAFAVLYEFIGNKATEAVPTANPGLPAAPTTPSAPPAA